MDSGFLSHSNDMHARLTGQSNLAGGVHMSVDVCFSLCVSHGMTLFLSRWHLTTGMSSSFKGWDEFVHC